MSQDERETTYSCVVGHVIPQEDLELRTEEWTLDGGARVRVCSEHGAPVAITQRPAGSVSASA